MVLWSQQRMLRRQRQGQHTHQLCMVWVGLKNSLVHIWAVLATFAAIASAFFECSCSRVGSVSDSSLGGSCNAVRGSCCPVAVVWVGVAFHKECRLGLVWLPLSVCRVDA